MMPIPLDNKERAKGVDNYIREFATATGLDISPEGDGPVTVVGDLICNLLHWVAIRTDATEALKAAQQGIGHFLTENAIDYDAEEVDELGPDSHVRIEATCAGTRYVAETGGNAYTEEA